MCIYKNIYIYIFRYIYIYSVCAYINIMCLTMLHNFILVIYGIR